MSPAIYLATICLPLGTVLAVFGMRYSATTKQAQSRLAHDAAYRRLVEDNVSAQREQSASLAALQAQLTDVQERQAAIERVLKQVE
jgi:Tfp pilus assembly protein PilO